tara:strand:- start:3 stop:272 length:270 start_codon:yes stop_codon:yes gene_type:complete
MSTDLNKSEIKENKENKPKKVKKKKPRCTVCKKKLGLCPLKCRCDENKFYCSKHVFSSNHNCTFDYKAAQKEQFIKNNPKVTFDKVNKI